MDWAVVVYAALKESCLALQGIWIPTTLQMKWSLDGLNLRKTPQLEQ
jgi:hypothetical protein